jgi:hypothetical protein
MHSSLPGSIPKDPEKYFLIRIQRAQLDEAFFSRDDAKDRPGPGLDVTMRRALLIPEPLHGLLKFDAAFSGPAPD